MGVARSSGPYLSSDRDDQIYRNRAYRGVVCSCGVGPVVSLSDRRFRCHGSSVTLRPAMDHLRSDAPHLQCGIGRSALAHRAAREPNMGGAANGVAAHCAHIARRHIGVAHTPASTKLRVADACRRQTSSRTNEWPSRQRGGHSVFGWIANQLKSVGLIKLSGPEPVRDFVSTPPGAQPDGSIHRAGLPIRR